MKIIFICAIALLAGIGIFNYVIATLKSKGKRISQNVYSAFNVAFFFIISALVMTFETILIRNPQAVFVSVHWLLVLALGVVLAVVLFFVGIKWINRNYSVSIGTTQIVLGICVLTMLVLGFRFAHRPVYEISEPEDINLLNNLPLKQNEIYYIEVTNDIDFDGVELKKSYGRRHLFAINGNGYSWTNMQYEAVNKSSISFLATFVSIDTDGPKSRIYDLTISNSEFSITPDNYKAKEHKGLETNFYLVSKYIVLENVRIYADVIVREPEDNIRYETKSYVSTIYPETSSVGTNKFKINVIREEE